MSGFASSLRHRVTIQAPVAVGDDPGGQPNAGFSDYAQAWADVRVLGGLESIKAGAETSTVKASIRMRYRTDVDASMRIVHGATTYNVKEVLPDGGRRRVDFVCEAVK